MAVPVIIMTVSKGRLKNLAFQVNAMYHDESIGDIKVTISVVRIALLHQGVSITDITSHVRKYL